MVSVARLVNSALCLALVTGSLPAQAKLETTSAELPESQPPEASQQIATATATQSKDSGDSTAIGGSTAINEVVAVAGISEGGSQSVSSTGYPNSTLLADAPLTSARLEAVTDEILRHEIELLMLNTQFRMATTDKGRLKAWRVFLVNLAGSGVATAGITTIAAERWRTWQRPATANRRTLKAGPILLLTSHSILTGSVLCESLLDFIKDQKLKKKGLDARTTQKKATELCTIIDEKLAQRDILVVQLAGLPPQDLSAIASEGQVLRDLRNRCLNEYEQFHVRAKKRVTARNVSYLNGISAATTGGYLGSLCGLLAVADRNPRLAGPAGIGFTISGANIASGPVLSRAAADLAGKRTKKRLEHQMPVVASSSLSEHIEALSSSSQALPQDANLIARISIYRTVDAIFKEQIQMNLNEKKKADKDFRERLVMNAAIGGSKMGWGIQLTNAGFGFHPAPAPPKASNARAKALLSDLAAKKKTPAQLFSKRVAQGATTYIPGTSLWILDTLQARLRGERDLYTMGSQSSLPHQKLQDRQKKIEQMRDTLKTIAPNP
ncbi:MAG: hypothetical protein U0105_13620 [Candidatus Obscuribacterales bacterium]